MLLDSFFTIETLEIAEDTIRSTLKFNRGHTIFNGHFPDVPVVPGVCMIQMVKEVIEHHNKESYKLVAGDNIKFLSVLNPDDNPGIEAFIQMEKNNILTITATLFAGEVTFLKLKAVLERCA
jgi:3-hydroxyacyl-[acyl-carrier-protein] dehydratase